MKTPDDPRQGSLFDWKELEGIDPESDMVANGDILEPFDPKDIKIAVEQKTIDNLVQRIKHEEVDLFTEFQRKGNLWKDDQQSRLIESILLRFPLPAFYFDANNDDKWLVVDGLQRLWTLKRFILDQKLVLNGLDILKDLNNENLTYTALPRSLQRRINETQITAYIIQPGTPKEVKYNVFRRINTGGLILNSMEIRHALNQGPATDFLNDLAAKFSAKFRVSSQRMEDRELVLRALSFFVKSSSDYFKPLSSFLDRTMEKLGSMKPSELEKMTTQFFRALETSTHLFGEHIFSRSILGGNHRKKMNAALFEIWMGILMRFNEEVHHELIKNRSKLIQSYKDLLMEEGFKRAITYDTASPSSVIMRFQGILSLIRKFEI